MPGGILGLLAMVVLGGATFIVPFRWLIIMGIGAFLLADSFYFGPRLTASSLYYGRFIPLGMMFIRATLPLAAGRVKMRSLPLFFILPAFLLFLLAFVSTAWALTPGTNVLRSLTLGMVIIGYGIGVPVFFRNLKEREKIFRQVSVLFAFAVAGSAIAYPFLSHGSFEQEGTMRVQGLFHNPNSLGLVAMVCFMPLFACWKAQRGRRLRQFYALLLAFDLLGLLLSGSRASAVGLLCGIAVYLFLGRGQMKQRIAIVVVLLLGAAIIMLFPGLSSGLFRTDTGLRMQLWTRAIHLGMHNPYGGYGYGSTDEVFRRDVPYLESMGVYSGGSHDEYLRMFVGLGFPGIVLVAVLLLSLLVNTLSAAVDRRRDPIILVLTATLIAGMVHSIFEDGLFAFGGIDGIPFWFYASILCLYLKEHQLSKARRAVPVRRFDGGQPAPPPWATRRPARSLEGDA